MGGSSRFPEADSGPDRRAMGRAAEEGNSMIEEFEE
jgi:hypothetical protein